MCEKEVQASEFITNELEFQTGVQMPVCEQSVYSAEIFKFMLKTVWEMHI